MLERNLQPKRQTDRHNTHQLVLLTAIAMELSNILILLSERTASQLSTGLNTTKWRNPYLYQTKFEETYYFQWPRDSTIIGAQFHGAA